VNSELNLKTEMKLRRNQCRLFEI